MKKSYIVLIVIAIVFITFYFGIKGMYNGMVEKNERVTSEWSNLESQYQRRMDLIPNLVNTVKGYAEHESSTLQAVVDARANATKVNINVDNLDESSIKKLNAVQGELSGALSRLLAVSENYPDLKANENFRDLQAQLEGTENRIAVARRNYNEIARDYNTTIRQFPRNIFAGMFGFISKPYFEASEGAEKAPEVKF